jgi:hypothetical protein
MFLYLFFINSYFQTTITTLRFQDPILSGDRVSATSKIWTAAKMAILMKGKRKRGMTSSGMKFISRVISICQIVQRLLLRTDMIL